MQKNIIVCIVWVARDLLTDLTIKGAKGQSENVIEQLENVFPSECVSFELSKTALPSYDKGRTSRAGSLSQKQH